MNILFLAVALLVADEPPAVKAEPGCSCSKNCPCTPPVYKYDANGKPYWPKDACGCIDNFGEPHACVNTKCGCAQRPKAEPKESHDYIWRLDGNDMRQAALYDNGKQIGAYWYSTEDYYRLGKGFDGEDRWIRGTLPPAAGKPPAKKRQYLNNAGRDLSMPIPGRC